MIEYVPYTDFHSLNLDWIIATIKQMDEKLDDYRSYSTIKYADPIEWNITTQYETNTVVINSDGTAYLSVQPVPSGIAITNTDYWTPIGNFSELWNDLKASICSIDLGSSTTATQAITEGSLFFMQNDLYKALNDISSGSLIVDGGNAEKKTLEDVIAENKADTDSQISALETDVNSTIQTFKSDINSQMSTFTQGIETEFSELSAQVTDIAENALNERIKDHVRYFIDGANGNDDNDGLTRETAFKTIDHALELTNRFTEVRFYIVSSGTYTITKGDVCAGCSIHVTAATSSVTLDFITADDDAMAVYVSHWNLQGESISNKMSVDCHGVDGNRKYIYFDNCLLTADSIAFLCYIRLFGGSSILTRCSIEHYRIDHGFFSFSDGIHVTNTDNTITPFEFINSYGRMIGNYSANELTEAGTGGQMVVVNNSRLIIGSVILPALTNSYYRGITTSNYGEVFITATRLNTIASRAVNGNNIVSMSVVWTDQGVQYPYMTRYYNSKHQYWDGSAWTNI